MSATPHTAAPTSARRLTVAERARTIVASAAELRVGSVNPIHDVGRHAVAPDGSLLFVVPPEPSAGIVALARTFKPQLLTAVATDVGSVAQPDRIRGRLTIVGRLALAPATLAEQVADHLVRAEDQPLDPSATIVRLVPTRIALAWLCEPLPGAAREVEVPVEEYRSASHDPIMAHEAQWLSHLQKDHPDVLGHLARRAVPGLSASADVRPVVVDRYGLVLRVREHGIVRPVRLGFSNPVRCPCEAKDAFAELLGDVR